MKTVHYTRKLKIPDRSFFLFGPRGVGKSTWLKENYKNANYYDLLDSSLFLELSRTPHHLEALVGSHDDDRWIVIDEIQKLPVLLDEVHRLMEKYRWKFALCGSSARSLKRGGVNLLAGRAITRNMESFSLSEIDATDQYERAIRFGLLPIVWADPDMAIDILNSYLNTYIKEEIRQEGILRKVSPFMRFLQIAGLMNGKVLNGQNIAREAGIPRSNVDVYFSILEDTLLGHFLPAWQPRLKVRERVSPKFYWFDPGVARAAAGLLREPFDSVWRSFALETLIYHELRVYNETSGKQHPIYFYQSGSGVEIDFVIEIQKALGDQLPLVALIEVKSSDKWDRAWERRLRDLNNRKGATVRRSIGVYTGIRRYHFNEIDVLPVAEFIRELYNGQIF